MLQSARRIQVTRMRVIQGGDVGGALNRGVAAEGQNAAARPANIAQQ